MNYIIATETLNAEVCLVKVKTWNVASLTVVGGLTWRSRGGEGREGGRKKDYAKPSPHTCIGDFAHTEILEAKQQNSLNE